MNAAIVLHGLFLLVCYQNQTCDIIVPHTMMAGKDVHDYNWLTVSADGKTLTPHQIPAQDPATIKPKPSKRMTLGSELTPAGAHPFHNGRPTIYTNYEFTLDGKQLKLALNSSANRNVIKIPWPNQILGANRQFVDSDSVTGNDANLAKLVLGPSAGGLYMFSETLVLLYDTGTQFSFVDENGKALDKATLVKNTWMMVLTSWPKQVAYSDHSAGVNQSLVDKNGKSPLFNFTSVKTGIPGGDESGVPGVGLPQPVHDPPPAPKGSVAQSIWTVISKDGKVEKRVIVKTGCGTVSLEDFSK